MIRLKVLKTGSSGNLFLIEEEGQSLLLEAGLPFKALRQKLNFKTSELLGCLITHEHNDHAQGVPGLIAAGVDVYMSRGTKDALGINSHRIKVIEKDSVFKIGRFSIKAFSVIHDAADPIGYLIKSGPDLMLFIVDTMYIEHTFPGLTIIAVEVNHCEKLLEDNINDGRYPAIRNRVRYNHMSIRTFKDFLKANDLSRVREIHMIHMSKINADPARFKTEVEEITGARVFTY